MFIYIGIEFFHGIGTSFSRSCSICEIDTTIELKDLEYHSQISLALSSWILKVWFFISNNGLLGKSYNRDFIVEMILRILDWSRKHQNQTY